MLTGITLAVLVVLAAAMSARALVCTEPTKCEKGMRGIRIKGVSQVLRLTWRCDADRAAAALLFHKLTQLHYCRLALCEAPLGPCKLLNDTDAPPNTLVVGVEKANMTKCTELLVLLGVGQSIAAAPMLPRLHVHLSSDVKNHSECAAAVTTKFYKRSDEHQKTMGTCGFSIPVHYYVPDKWSEAVPQPPLESIDVELKRFNCTWAELAQKVDSDPSSFLFLDSELWDGLDSVSLVRAFYPYVSPPDDAELQAPVQELEKYEPSLLRVLREFAPGPQTLRKLLKLEMNERAYDPGERALQALTKIIPSEIGALTESKQPISDLEVYRVLAFVCDSYNENDTKQLVKEIELAIKTLTNDSITVKVEHSSLDCSESTILRSLLNWYLKKMFSVRYLGAAIVGPGVANAANSDVVDSLPLVAYDAQPSTENLLAIGGRADDVARALLAALEACGWRRIALLSDDSLTGQRIAEVLLSKLGSLAVEKRIVRGDGAATIQKKLRALRSQDARVFVVNGNGYMAAQVLKAGHAEGLAECVWIAREWGGGAPPVTLLALRVGAHKHEHLTSGNTTWWPPHKAPLVDALLSLVVAFMRALPDEPEIRFDHQMRGTQKLFQEKLEKPFIAGPPNLLYNVQRAHAPPMGLELWVPAYDKPVSTSNNTNSCLVLPPYPSDGAVRCDLPYGDEFSPLCLDTAVVVGVPLLLLATLVASYLWMVRVRAARARRLARARRVRAEAAAELVVQQGECVAALLPWLVERDTVREVRVLGAGRFGRVWLAALGAGQYVAAKEPHDGTGPGEEGALLREAALLARLRHDHVVRLVGVCVGGGPPLALTEPAFFGDLQSYLRARRPLLALASPSDEAQHVSAEALTRLAREAALALHYLAECRLVHCDVRAANCLVDERRSLKLADFGMARSTGGGSGGAGGAGIERGAGGEYACRRRALFPVLWMAPESLEYGVFSHASDVWALGVLALELVTLGARPFGSLEAHAVVELVRSGGHAPLPPFASAMTRRLARACWQRSARERPAAEVLAVWLTEQPRALKPALKWDTHEEDGDSGFAEPPTSASPEVDPFPGTDLDPA